MEPISPVPWICINKPLLFLKDDLHEPFIESRSDLEKSKSLGVDEYPEEVLPEEFASFYDTDAATEPMLSVNRSRGW